MVFGLQPPTWLLLALEAGGLLLALLISAAAFRARRLVRARPLLLFGLGFAALGVAQACALWLEVQNLTARRIPSGSFDFFDVAFWAYYACLLVGLGLVFASFGRRPFKWTPALAPVLSFAGAVLQLLVVTFLFFVVLHAGLNHIARARRGSFQTALGFFLLLVAHLLFLQEYLPLSPRTWLGELANLGGLLLLYLSTSRARKT